MVDVEQFKAEYTDATEAGAMLNIGRSRVCELCNEGRFNGAFRFGGFWIIPRAAVLSHKPLPRGPKRKTPSREQDAALLSSAIEAAKGNAYQNDTKRGQK